MSSASSYSNLVQELYVAYFGRPADYFGLQNFEAALAAANAPTDPAALAAAYSTNAAVKTLVDSFGTSHESTALYGSGSTESFVNAIFENLFNRPAAVAGLTFWVNAINSGAVSKGDAALAILAGAESNSTTQGKADWTLIGNKIGVASNFTTALGSSSSQIVAYAGATAAQDARLMLSGVTASTTPATFDVQTTINNIVAGNSQNTYNLTTGVDTLTGGTGNNVFNAILDNATGLTAGGQAATLQSFDSITGGTSNNTLNITDFGKSYFMTIPSGAAISGITTVNVNTLESIGSSPSTPVDFSALGANMAAVNINSSYGVDSVKVGTSTALAVTNTFANGDVYTTGGSSVTINNNSSSSVQGNYIHVTGDASTTSVTVNNGFNNTMVVYDANYASTSKANTISTVTLNNLNQYHSVNLYTSALTQLNLTNVSNTWINEQVDTTGTARTLNVALNGLDSATPASYTEVYTYATTVDVATSGAASVGFYLYAGNATTVAFNDAADLSFFNGTSVGSGYLVAPSATSLTIAGAGAFTADLSGLAAGAAINASGSSGTITVNMASANSGDATQSFTGGTGQDIVTVGAGQTGTVTGGSATNNEIILDNAPGATEAALAAYSHFSILGVAGSTSGTFDMSKLPGYNSFDVQSSSGNVTFTNVAIPTDTTHPLSLSLEGGNTHVVTLQTNDKTGANDSVSVTLGTTSTGSNSYAQVTLEDSIFGGIGTVNLASNVKASASANTLTSLYDNNWVTLNVSGTGSLDIGTSKVSSSSLTINNTEVAHGTGSLNIANLNDNSLTSLTFNGTDGTTIANLNTTSTGLTLIDNDTAAVKITTLNDTALTSATFTNSVNSTAATFTIGGTLTEAGLATLNLNGNVKISVAGDAVTTGITVAGATDNADVSFSATGATASGKANSIALGNGNDTVVLGTASVAAVPGATETDTVTWQPIAGTAPATEKIDVTWQAFSTLVAGTETIGGMTITSDGSAIFSADQVAKVAAGVASVPGLTLTTPASGWTVATGVGTTDTYFTSTTANTAEPTPTDATATGSGATPTFTETTVGTPGTGGTESIGGVTVSTTINGTYNAGQVAIVAAGGSVPGLSLTSTPTLWAVGTASGSSNLFTSTTANHAEPGPAGATATGAGSAPTSVQTTAGVTPVPASGGGGLAGSSDTITVGTGNDSITDFSAGTVTVSATESSTSTDSITANVASTLHVTAGNGINTISDTAASASTTISVGTGANSITVGNMASGTIALGTHAATVVDSITLGNSGSVTTSVAGMEKISGLNNVGADTLVFSGDAAPITAITEITATQVHNLGGDTTLLADWIATAAGKGAAVTANTVAWFSYQGNTYLVNLTAADHGNLSANDTVVELTGTYTFANTHFGGNGTIHLMG